MSLSTWVTAATAAVAAALLPACDGITLQELKPGVSTAAEVRARMGNPNYEHRNDDGTVTWEFNRQPNGVECHMLTFDANQVLVKVEQVLTAAYQAKVREGMGKDEVRRLLGKPGQVQTFANLHEEVWDWRVAGTIPTEEAHFHVHFDTADGLVKKTSRRVEIKG